ncbi:MAG: flagellar hook-length control protein FliK [Proteobacteria bacterium]|nr:flagellar hook-length control protein FliK [Pseudomonadota bacterium]MBU1685925.1 flagellar hook-length control protein FliK [Pseudomonadota bacterium]
MKILPSTHQTTFKIIGPADPSGNQQATISDVQLKPGQLLQARVQNLLPDGKVLLEIEGRAMTATSLARLTAGSTIWLEVREAGAEPLLVLAGKKAAAGALLRLLLSNSSLLTKSVASLTMPSASPEPGWVEALFPNPPVLESVSINGEAQPGKVVETLLAILRVGNGGPGLKNPLSRLAHLVDVLADVHSLDRADPASVQGHKALEGFAKLAELMEGMRNLNSQAVAQDQLPFYLIPCFFMDGGGWGQWLFYAEPESATAEGGGYHLDFFLEMSRLGDMHISLNVGLQRLHGSIDVVNEEVRGLLLENLDELKGILNAAGFDEVILTCQLVGIDLHQTMKETIEKQARLQKISLVDIRT